MQSNQLGRSMIEMLGVLSIIGVLSVGGFSMVKKMQNSYDTNKIMEEISAFTRKARSVIREYESGGSLTLNEYINAGKAVPEGITLNADKKFAGTAGIIYTFDLNPSETNIKNALFKMTMTGVPEEICMQVATADWGSVATSGFKGMKIGDNVSIEPLSLGTAASDGYCGSDNTISLFYR